jgi:hypothetical protein
MPLMPGSLKSLDLLDTGSRTVVRLMFFGIGFELALAAIKELVRSADDHSPLVPAFMVAMVGSFAIMLGLLAAITFRVRGGRGYPTNHRVAFRLAFVAIYTLAAVLTISQSGHPWH